MDNAKSSAENDAIVHQLTIALIENDIEIVKNLTNSIPPNWCSTLDKYGNTLLQESILRKNKEVFDILLPFHDVESLETRNISEQSALMVAFSRDFLYRRMDYFACKLLEKGVRVDEIDNDNETFLHKTISCSLICSSKLLLERGIDANVQNIRGDSAFHKIPWGSKKTELSDEYVALLMYYNADPLIANNQGCRSFEWAFHTNCSTSIRECLFLYTFDEYTNIKLDISIPLMLALDKSSFFYILFKYNVDIVINSDDPFVLFRFLKDLFRINFGYLEILMKKCSSVVKQIISSNSKHVITTIDRSRDRIITFYNMKNLEIILESGASRCMEDFIQSLDSFYVFFFGLQFHGESQSYHLLSCLLSLGLDFGGDEYDMVFSKFGYCDLFKLMLHVGARKKFDPVPKNPTARLIYDINFDLGNLLDCKTVHSDFPGLHLKIDRTKLLEYFAHPKLEQYFVKLMRHENFPNEVEEKIRNHPKIPLLVEMSRNTFRKFLVDKLKIENESHFYSVVNSLNISKTHKKIITFEMQLY